MELINAIKSRYLSSDSVPRPIDFSCLASYFTLDVITEVAFGSAFGYLSKDEDVYDLIKISQNSLTTSQYIATFPALTRLLGSNIFRRFIMPSAKDKVGLGKYMAYVSRLPRYLVC